MVCSSYESSASESRTKRSAVSPRNVQPPRAVNLLAAGSSRPRTDAIRVHAALMKHTFNDAPFVVQPLKDGVYRVHCVTVGPSIEVRARFLTKEKAQNWIRSESKAWLEKLVAQAMDLKAPPAIPFSSPGSTPRNDASTGPTASPSYTRRNRAPAPPLRGRSSPWSTCPFRSSR